MSPTRRTSSGSGRSRRRFTGCCGPRGASSWRSAGGGGPAAPPNLMSVPNTRSNEVYLRRCKAAGVAPHPARFPFEVPEFFVRFLTTEGQMVYDPFAGSNVTGAAAEAEGRRWISTEIHAGYVEGSRYRFE